MYGVKPDRTKVKVFGCEVYEHISKQSNTGLGQRLNPRAKAFMYVGHSETTTADSYKLYYRVNKTVKTGSISKYIENVDEYGKVLSKHNHSYAHDFTVRETLPEDFCEGKEEAEKFLVKVVQDFDLYHDSKNGTTHLLIKTGLRIAVQPFLSEVYLMETLPGKPLPGRDRRRTVHNAFILSYNPNSKNPWTILRFTDGSLYEADDNELKFHKGDLPN